MLIYYYAMLLSTRPSPLKLDLSLFSSFTGAGTPLPDYHSIKVASPFCEWPRPHRPLSLCVYLEDSSMQTLHCLPSLLLPLQHVLELLIDPRLLFPLLMGYGGGGRSEDKEETCTSVLLSWLFFQWNAWLLITVTQHWLLLTETPVAQDEWRTD